MPEFTAFQGEVALRLAVSALAGAGIGLERELRDQAAGLRTHMLVAVGACLFGLVSAFGFDAVIEGAPPDPVRYDPSRVASNIVTGVGFLGAGAIIRHGLSIRGLTTAASLWVVAAIGTAVSLGMYWAVIVTALITILSLWGLRIVRGRIRRAVGVDRERLTLRLSSEETLDEALELCRRRGYRVRRLDTAEEEDTVVAHIEFERLHPGERIEVVLAELTGKPGVLGIDREEA